MISKNTQTKIVITDKWERTTPLNAQIRALKGFFSGSCGLDRIRNIVGSY